MNTVNTVDMQSLQQLREAEVLLREGLRRIADVQSDFPSAQNPLEEVLRLSEGQAMTTLAAVERGQAALSEIQRAHRQYIDRPLSIIGEAFSEILESQQAQDLAGQRLKKAITLLQAVDSRIAKVMEELRPTLGLESASAPDVSAAAEQTFQQADVDALLAELGI